MLGLYFFIRNILNKLWKHICICCFLWSRLLSNEIKNLRMPCLIVAYNRHAVMHYCDSKLRFSMSLERFEPTMLVSLVLLTSITCTVWSTTSPCCRDTGTSFLFQININSEKILLCFWNQLLVQYFTNFISKWSSEMILTVSLTYLRLVHVSLPLFQRIFGISLTE